MAVDQNETQYSKITALKLVYPPVSNQEAEWLSKVPEVEELWRQSDFYMIAARAEARVRRQII